MTAPVIEFLVTSDGREVIVRRTHPAHTERVRWTRLLLALARLVGSNEVPPARGGPAGDPGTT